MPNSKNEKKRLDKEVLKLNESELRKELERYKSLLEVLPELVFEMTLSGKITYVNQSGLDKFGYTIDEFKENFSLKAFFPEDFESISENLSKLIKNEPFEKRRYLALKKDGGRFPVILSTTLVKEKAVPMYIRGIAIDVTEQTEIEERFRKLFISSPFPTVIINPDTGGIFMSNPQASDLFGVNNEELNKGNIFFYILDTGEVSFKNYIKSVDDQDSQLNYTTLLSRKDGLDRNVTISSKKINYKGNKFIQSVFQDITEIKRRELREIKERKQKELLALSVFQLNQYKDKDSMFKYIAQTLYAFNPSSIVIVGDYLQEKNKMTLNHILGLKAERISEILNIDITKFELDVVDYPMPENRLFVDIEKVLAEKEDKINFSDFKFKILKKVLNVKKILTTKLIANKKILGGVSILTPNEKFLEENEFIEIFVSQASIILDRISYENQLIEAKEAAIESDRLKSAFLSNMSHEIRTPMNSILGFSNLILSEDLTEDLKNKYSSLIQNSGEVLVKLIDDIIDISKIESNQLEVLQEEFTVNDIVSELEVEYSNLKDENIKKIQILFKNTAEPVRIKSDRSRIKQILNNLINNSIKFTNKGTIEVSFNIKNGKIYFRVKDSGIGIPKEKQKIIFDRFRQADESSTRPFRGAGLGLAISKHLANILGGDILVSSQKNVGTEFIVSLPTNMVAEIYHQKQYIKPIKNSYEDWDKYTVYIAEDEDSNFFLLEAYLKETELDLHWFKNGVELIKALKKNQPDLILLDLKMPEMDGYTAAAKIRKKYPELYIIAQTAYAMADEKNKAMKSGCNDFITKPIKKEVLYYKIAKYLNR